MTHLKADLAWAGVRVMLAGQKRFTLPRKELPSSTPERHPKAHVLVDERAPMRDGVTLATDVYLPAGADGRPAGAAFPAILIRMPYGIREPYAYMPAIGRYWARRGYACVVQDVRGKYGSEGEWDPFRHEVDDGYDAIEWTAHQSWCDGRVGMTGESYFGHTQWAAAASHHPALRCISPGDMGCDVYALLYEGGALALGSTALWACDQARHAYINWLRFDTRHLPLAADGRRGRAAQPPVHRADRPPEPRRVLARVRLPRRARRSRRARVPVERVVRQHAGGHARLLDGDGGGGRGGRRRRRCSPASLAHARADRPRDVARLHRHRGAHPAAGGAAVVGPRARVHGRGPA